MFQDIAPHVLDIAHKNRKPVPDDFLISYKNNEVLMNETDGEIILPTISEAGQLDHPDTEQLIYLFDIDDKGFFLSSGSLPEAGNLTYRDIRIFRKDCPGWVCFGGATAVHLARWYENNRFCGKCGRPMSHKENERALYCPSCGFLVYPRINPVVMVAITDGDRLLLTRYAHAEYKHYSLVAGFMEIGETVEDAIRREVMEEVSLKVKNIRYYKSQPWAFSESLLIGFFADVDGKPEPVADGEELSEASWFHRNEIPAGNSTFSLTWNMIEHFRKGNI